MSKTKAMDHVKAAVLEVVSDECAQRVVQGIKPDNCSSLSVHTQVQSLVRLALQELTEEGALIEERGLNLNFYHINPKNQ